MFLTMYGEARTITVDPEGNGDFESIQGAVNGAEEGDIIRVHDGIYHQKIVINRRVHVIGNGSQGTVIKGDGVGSVVRLTANDTKISGFHILGSGGGSYDAGIRVESSGCQIEDVYCTNNTIGISLMNAGDATIYGSEIQCSTQHGIILKNSTLCTVRNTTSNSNALDGIFIDDQSSSNSIISSQFSGNRNGISVAGSHNLIQMNRCSNNTNGITVTGSDHSMLGNVCIHNTRGAHLRESSYTYFQWNDLSGNTIGINLEDSVSTEIAASNLSGNTEMGVRSFNSSSIIINENSIDGNGQVGIRFFQSSDIEVTNNTFRNNTIGMSLEEGSLNIVVHRNSFSGNIDFALHTINNDGIEVNATYNSWGHESGPYYRNSNPEGTGDNVTDFVLFHPWLTDSAGEFYAEISGFVTDPYGTPLPLIIVSISYYNADHALVTDPDGFYSLTDILISNQNITVRITEPAYLNFSSEFLIRENTSLDIFLMPRDPMVIFRSFLPAENSVVDGIVLLSGSVTHLLKYRINIQMRIDDEDWIIISNDTRWEYELDTMLYENGNHVICVRAFDGTLYSRTISHNITFQNPVPHSEDSSLSMIILIGFVSIIAVIVILFLAFRLNAFIDAAIGKTNEKVRTWEIGETAKSNRLTSRIMGFIRPGHHDHGDRNIEPTGMKGHLDLPTDEPDLIEHETFSPSHDTGSQEYEDPDPTQPSDDLHPEMPEDEPNLIDNDSFRPPKDLK